MSRINASADGLRDFARKIENFIDEQEDILSRLRSSYTDMSSEWNDIQYERFGEIIDEIINNMKNVIPTCEDTIYHLQNKADILEDYIS